MAVIKKQKNKAYILLESLVALGTLVTICSLILTAVDQGRQQEVELSRQTDILQVAQMAVQTRRDQLTLNGITVRVERTEDGVLVYHEGQEVLAVEKN
ncbi:TPA: competence type IV pilus minor pilin ComGE [Streptococcus suis]